MTVTSQEGSTALKQNQAITVPLGAASALFDMSDEEFVSRFVRRGQIHSDKLHQFRMRDVLKLYNATKDRKEWIAKSAWFRHKDLDEIANTLRKIGGVVYSSIYLVGDSGIDSSFIAEYEFNKTRSAP